MGLTDQQQSAAEAVVDACVLVQMGGRPKHFVLDAVAGSGKSSTLVSMVERLASANPSANILVLQYNQEACVQMKERLEQIDAPCTVHVHTIHSFGLQLLGSPPVDPEKLYKLLHRTVNLNDTDPEEVRHRWVGLQRSVDSIRHSAQRPTFTPRPLTLQLTILEAALRDRGVLDHEDAVYHCIYYHAHNRLFFSKGFLCEM